MSSVHGFVGIRSYLNVILCLMNNKLLYYFYYIIFGRVSQKNSLTMFTKRLQKPTCKIRFLKTGSSYQYKIVIGLHAVQSGNNWMKKNSEESQNCKKKFFEFNFITSKLDKLVVLLFINNIAGQLIQTFFSLVFCTFSF